MDQTTMEALKTVLDKEKSRTEIGDAVLTARSLRDSARWVERMLASHAPRERELLVKVFIVEWKSGKKTLGFEEIKEGENEV